MPPTTRYVCRIAISTLLNHCALSSTTFYDGTIRRCVELLYFDVIPCALQPNADTEATDVGIARTSYSESGDDNTNRLRRRHSMEHMQLVNSTSVLVQREAGSETENCTRPASEAARDRHSVRLTDA